MRKFLVSILFLLLFCISILTSTKVFAADSCTITANSTTVQYKNPFTVTITATIDKYKGQGVDVSMYAAPTAANYAPVYFKQTGTLPITFHFTDQLRPDPYKAAPTDYYFEATINYLDKNDKPKSMTCAGPHVTIQPDASYTPYTSKPNWNIENGVCKDISANPLIIGHYSTEQECKTALLGTSCDGSSTQQFTVSDPNQCTKERCPSDFQCGALVDNPGVGPIVCTCYANNSSGFDPNAPNLHCKTLKNDPNGQSCSLFDSAIGDIDTSPSGFVKKLMSLLLSIGGGIAVIMIIIAGYAMMTSQGNPEKLQEAQGRLTSAIVGLLFIVFSLVILEIIGVDILHIPGFSAK